MDLRYYMNFKLQSDYNPAGDQPQAIEQLVRGIETGANHQVLLGVTGSGKTFTMANVIAKLNRPTLIISHNKTLAAQLYSEFKQFFPENAVEYFISYYDYYQPEAYIPSTDTYIEKDMSINEEIERFRLSTTTQLLSGRNDIIVVASVSCLFGIGNPENAKENAIELVCGEYITVDKLMFKLIVAAYTRNDVDLQCGSFRVKGDTIDIYLAYSETMLRVMFWGSEIESIESINPVTGEIMEQFTKYTVYPANIFMITKEQIELAVNEIAIDLDKEVEHFVSTDKIDEANRLSKRVNYDLEMIKELGWCSGIENYSRYFDKRSAGTRPFCLFDYFPKDYLLFIDESHATVPQIRGMYGGDASRKKNLVEYGFRLNASIDNRPLRFEEYEMLVENAIYVSATPAEYELNKSGGVIVEQVVRPTGLLDPKIYVRPSQNQIDDLMEEIRIRTSNKERTLVTTLTKRMAEELDAYLRKSGVKCAYIHSDVETFDRVKIIEQLREGVFDVLIGVNLLREGLDLPQVSLVAIIDADKEGFLRNHRSLTQTAGRAARNINGTVIMYADRITKSMEMTITETNRRREKQMAYNAENNITPKQIINRNVSVLMQEIPKSNSSAEAKVSDAKTKTVISSVGGKSLTEAIENARKKMLAAATALNFTEAAQWRNELARLEKILG
jgi:excinuclease ABC subunit B